MVVKRAPARIIVLVNPTARGKSEDWIKLIKKVKKDGLMKLDRIRKMLGNKKTSNKRGCSA